MATIVNMHQAKSQLSKLVERALAGEEVIVARAGKPAVKLVPCEAAANAAPAEKKLRPIGGFENKIWLAPDWNDPWPEDFIDEFYKDDPLITPPRTAQATTAAEPPGTYDVSTGKVASS